MLYSILEGSLCSRRMNWEEQVQRRAWCAVRGAQGSLLWEERRGEQLDVFSLACEEGLRLLAANTSGK